MSSGTKLIISSQVDMNAIKDIIKGSGNSIKQAIQNTEGINVFTDELKEQVLTGGSGGGSSDTQLIYGIRWNSNTDTMTKGIVADGVFVENDYTSYPIQEQMKRVLRTSNDDITELDPTDSSLLAAGGAATLDGSAGQVMVQIPRFYMVTTVVGDAKYLLISSNGFVFSGVSSWVPPIYDDFDYCYIGAFKGVADTDSTSAVVKSIVKDTSGYSSNLYSNPFTNRTRDQFRTQQQDGFFSYCWSLYEVVWTMYLTEYADWDTQSTIPGYTEASSWDYSYTRPSGRTLSLGNTSGSVQVDLDGVDSDLTGIVASDKYIANSYRGIENFYGSVYEFIDGINLDNTDGSCHVYVCHTPVNFTDDTTVNYIDTGHAPAFGDLDGWITDMCWLGEDLNFYPSSITGGSSSTYICDYHSNTSGAWGVVRCGGYHSLGATAGLGTMNTYSVSSFTHSVVSTRTAALSTKRSISNPPSDVVSLDVMWDAMRNKAVFYWDHITDIDRSKYEIRSLGVGDATSAKSFAITAGLYVPNCMSGNIITVGTGKDHTTINGAITAASTGDLICIDPGTYNEIVILEKHVHLMGMGTSPDEVQIISSGGHAGLGIEDTVDSGQFYNNVKELYVQNLSLTGGPDPNAPTYAISSQLNNFYVYFIRCNILVQDADQYAISYNFNSPQVTSIFTNCYIQKGYSHIQTYNTGSIEFHNCELDQALSYYQSSKTIVNSTYVTTPTEGYGTDYGSMESIYDFKSIDFTIPHTEIDESLIDFPVMLNLSASSGTNEEDLTPIFDELGTNKYKLQVEAYKPYPVDDDFSGEDDSYPDPLKWGQDGTVAAVIINNRLETWDTGSKENYARIKGLFTIGGDIDISIKWDILADPGSVWYSVIGIHVDDDNNISCGRYHHNSGNKIQFNHMIAGTYVYDEPICNNTTGYVRLTRVSDVISAYWKANENDPWIQIADSLSGFPADTPGIISIQCLGYTTSTLSKVAWSDFKVTQGEITFDTPPSPVLTQCPVEIEYWDNVNQQAILWTKLPHISMIANTILTLKYSPDMPDNTSYVGVSGSTAAQQVWDDNYAAVYHMAQDPSIGGTCILDSTSYATHGTPNGSMTSTDLVDGEYGKALEFDGVDDRIVLDNSLVTSTNLTIIATINTSAIDIAHQCVLCKGASGTANYSLYVLDDEIHFQFYNNGWIGHTSTGVDLSINTNYVVVCRYDLTNQKVSLFVDGLNVYDAIETTSLVGTSETIYIGHDSGAEWFFGSIGNVIVSLNALSDQCISSTNKVLKDNLLTVGTIDQTPVNEFLITIDHEQIDEDIYDFPLMINLSNNSSTSGFDTTRIFDKLGTNKYKLQVEAYKPYPVDDDFSGEDGSYPDPLKWGQNGTVDAVIINDQLETWDAGSTEDYARVYSLFKLSGDIDISAKWSILEDPGSVWYAHIQFYMDPDNNFLCGRYHYSSGQKIVFGHKIDGNYTYEEPICNNTTGYVRLTRVSDVISAYWKANENDPWIQVADSLSGFSVDTPGCVIFKCSSYNVSALSKVAWSDFKVTQGEITFDTPPPPVLTQCPVEIEYWDTVNEKAVLWTKVPYVSSSSDTSINLSFDSILDDNTMYVGNTGSATAQQVWDDNYVAVYHMAQDPSTGGACILDSTSYANHGTPYGAMTSDDLVDGEYGKALNFDGVDDYISLSNKPLSNLEAYTIESKINIKSFKGDSWISLYRENDNGWGGYGPDLAIQDSNKIVRFSACGNSSPTKYIDSLSTILTGDFYTSTITYLSSGAATLYTNGTLEDAIEKDIAPCVSERNGIFGYYNNTTGVPDYNDIIYDTLRLSNIERSSTWIKASDATMKDTLTSIVYKPIDPTYQLTISSSIVDEDVSDFPIAIPIGDNVGINGIDLTEIFTYAPSKTDEDFSGNDGDIFTSGVFIPSVDIETKTSIQNNALNLSDASIDVYSLYLHLQYETLTDYDIECDISATALVDGSFQIVNRKIYLIVRSTEITSTMYDGTWNYLQHNTTNITVSDVTLRQTRTGTIYRNYYKLPGQDYTLLGEYDDTTDASGCMGETPSLRFDKHSGSYDVSINEFRLNSGPTVWTYVKDNREWENLHVEVEGISCPIEVEYWDSTNKKGLIHTKIPSISSIEDTTIKFIVKTVANSSIGLTSSATAQQVWDDNYVAVYHMAQDPSTGGACILDSTSHANHGTPYGAMTSDDLVDGEYGKALDLGGVDDNIDCGGSDDFNLPIGTVEALCNLDSINSSSYHAIVSKDQLDANIGDGILGIEGGIINDVTNNRLFARIYDTGDQYVESNNDFQVGSWVYAGITFGDDLTLFENGLPVDSHTTNQGWTNPNVNLQIGMFSTGTRRFDGKIGEVRISNVMRVDTWIKLTNLSSRNNLFTMKLASTSLSYDAGTKVAESVENAIGVTLTDQDLTNTYGIKAIDTDGNYSTNAATCNITT